MLRLIPLFHFSLTSNQHFFTYDELSSSVLSSVPMMQKLSFMLVSSRLGYCNALFIGLPATSIARLQYIQNSAARILTRTKRSAHITPILADLHWLPVAYRIKFKIILLAFKALNGLAPYYLCSLLLPYSPPRSLRSSDSLRPSVSPLFHGGADLSVLLPLYYGTLYQDHGLANSLSEFKTHLFSECYLS